MRWLLLLIVWRAPAVLPAQTSPSPPPSSASPQVAPPVSSAPSQASKPEALPDSPGATRTYRQSVSVTTASLPPCKPGQQPVPPQDPSSRTADVPPQCLTPSTASPYQRFLNSPAPFPLTPRQKGLLAIHDLVDPGNIFTITANAAFTVGIDPRTGYGPGWKGFGRDIGYSFVQDATGEVVSTFALDSLLHEDPHYHRSPQAAIPRRFLHAISHTVRSQHDDGTPMPNYSTLLTYPISAEIANLYVPGVHGNGESTVERVALGLAANPIDDLITEFLPDFARRVHIRVIFVQQILNNVAGGQPL